MIWPALRRCVLIAALITAAAIPARAQQHVVTLKYSKQMPPAIRRAVPRGGKSLFFGTCRMAAGGPALQVHFYRTAAIVKRHDSTGLWISEPVHKLDIYEGTGRHSRRVNSTKFVFATGYPKFGADILWVDPQTRRMPVVRVHYFDPNGFYGMVGGYLLLAYPQAWRGPASVHRYSYGGDLREANSVQFDRVDERGFLMPVTSYGNRDHDGDSSTEHRWNGEKFVAGATKIKRYP